MSKTPRRETKSLFQLETAARDALAGRGVLHVGTSTYGYGDAVIHFALDMAEAHAIAAAIPGFHLVTTYRTESGATARGYMTNAETAS
jgi:hypothetical protein